MKALVMFRSHYGNTKQVAEAIAGQIGALGHESVIQDLRQRLPDLKEIAFIFVGAPTRMGKVTRKALRVLKRLRKLGLTQKPIAIFDTYGPEPTNPEELEKAKKWLYPGAAGILHEAAKSLGLTVYPNTLRCEVKGMKGPLAEHELDKAATFVREFISTFSQKNAD